MNDRKGRLPYEISRKKLLTLPESFKLSESEICTDTTSEIMISEFRQKEFYVEEPHHNDKADRYLKVAKWSQPVLNASKCLTTSACLRIY